jgi:hypothetical protein
MHSSSGAASAGARAHVGSIGPRLEARGLFRAPALSAEEAEHAAPANATAEHRRGGALQRHVEGLLLDAGGGLRRQPQLLQRLHTRPDLVRGLADRIRPRRSNGTPTQPTVVAPRSAPPACGCRCVAALPDGRDLSARPRRDRRRSSWASGSARCSARPRPVFSATANGCGPCDLCCLWRASPGPPQAAAARRAALHQVARPRAQTSLLWL